jgi:GNAT superfamily N-acetyltransferase
MQSEVQLLIDEKPVTVRRANAQELIDLRHRVLRAMLAREAAMFPGDDDASSYHFGAFDGSTNAALCCATFHFSIWEDQPAYQLRGMATDPAWAGKGLGRAVMQLAVETITAQTPIRQFWCNGRVVAIPFYQKLGWRIASERFDVPYAGPHHRLVYKITR